MLQRRLHYKLRLGPRDEDSRGHFEKQPAKFLPPQNVLERLSPAAFPDSGEKDPAQRFVDVVPKMGQQGAARLSQGVCQQDFGIDPGVDHGVPGQFLTGGGEGFENPHGE